MKQNNQSSWAARLRKISALCLMLVATSSAWADDYLTALVKPGETKQLSIQLKNATDYTAFQMTIKLPDGLEFASSNPVLTNRKDASHQLEFNKEDASTMKLAVYSYDADANKGNEIFTKGDNAELLLLNVTVTNENYKAKEIEVSDIIFVKKEGLEGDQLPIASKGKLGDANGDDKLNTTDASTILMKLADKPIEGTYDEEAADFNLSGKVNTVDVTDILKELVK
jgi:hypothetical protein